MSKSDLSRMTTPEGPSPVGSLVSAQVGDMSRRTLGKAALGGTMFMGYAAALGASANPIITDERGIITQEIDFIGGGESLFAPSLPAYVARPEAAGPHPVVIVVSEIFGLHAYIQDICRRLAKLGYVAMAPGYFARAGDPALMTDFQEILAIVRTANNAQVMSDTGAALRWLDAQPYADISRAGITGFCWGGSVVWMACAAHDFKAGGAWYGRLIAPESAPEAARPWPIDIVSELRCPVLGFYARDDGGILIESVEAMRAALAEAGQSESEIIVYPGTQHGFHADYRPMFNQEAAEDGWSRLTALFAERLV